MPFPAKKNAPVRGLDRREFCAGAVAGCAAAGILSVPSARLLASGFRAQPAPVSKDPTRPDVAAIDRARILAAAGVYLKQAPAPLTSLRCERSPGSAQDYYSEAEPPDAPTADARAKTAGPPPFTAHRDALFTVGLAVGALTGAYVLTGDDRYAQQAVSQLRAWFVDSATSMSPRLDYGQTVMSPREQLSAGQASAAATASVSGGTRATRVGGQMEGILETLPLVEIARAIPFLAASPALTDADRAALNAWFGEYLRWLTAPEDSGPRLPALARDSKDHHGTSWLLQVSAYTFLTLPESSAPKSEAHAMEELRHRYRTVTLRAQINAQGEFPHELPSAYPYRNSLFNLDMLAGVCQLLTTRFDNVWEYELEDGPGMRSAIAYHFPYIADRTQWPFRSDATGFNELPGRRASLLLTSHVYGRPEYAALWMKLPPDPPAMEILRTMPIHQPLLWVREPARQA
jgi:hypothetical protein